MSIYIALLSAVLTALSSLAGCGSLAPDSDARVVSYGGQDAAKPTSRPDSPPADGSIRVSVFNGEGVLVPNVVTTPIERSAEEWRASLTEKQYEILRESGTEYAFSGDLLDLKQHGVYTCAGCRLPLFTSDSKFKSGTGWPSFYEAIGVGNVTQRVDTSLGMRRIEINCGRCDGHLGHVFDDGPKPTGKRYCVNSAALGFTPQDKLAVLADPAADGVMMSEMKEAVFAGGCFWCVEAVFEELEGVQDAVSGYSGGKQETANYKDVCSGQTGHAEAVKIIYDPSKISYTDLLRVHFATHDPTQLNRQGNDIGPQYRSAIFYADDQEKAIAEAFIADLTEQDTFSREIVTTLEPLGTFYEAERYHQNYVCQNPNQSYIRGVALPKVEKVRKQFKELLKDESPLDVKQ